jgi:hypothetical protein
MVLKKSVIVFTFTNFRKFFSATLLVTNEKFSYRPRKSRVDRKIIVHVEQIFFACMRLEGPDSSLMASSYSAAAI